MKINTEVNLTETDDRTMLREGDDGYFELIRPVVGHEKEFQLLWVSGSNITTRGLTREERASLLRSNGELYKPVQTGSSMTIKLEF